uniref:Protein IBD2 n=1 Tax=Talaromyces marneffei PM1 TaxID=1077442 RepID=A0A093UMV1_TALMA
MAATLIRHEDGLLIRSLALGGTYSATPDTPSPIYPDRLIRPLPKRPLRSRLSPEAAESILFPPAPPVSQLFYGSYSDHHERQDSKYLMRQHSVDPYSHDHSPDRDHRHPYENGVSEVESGDESGSVVVRRRGRYGRHAPRVSSGRNSLPVHPQGAWFGARPGGSRRDSTPSSHIGTGEIGSKSDQGIISTAIANAAALSPSPRGPNNVSLLDQQASRSSPTKTQFTFTCESDSSKSIAMHSTNPYPMSHPRMPNSSLHGHAPNPRDFATQGTQTSPNMGAMGGQQLPPPPAAGTPAANPGQRPKRSRDSIYALAARRRRIQQHYTNIHNPPSPEEFWMCEFCEYEAIFGEPPRALIRQYEIKDRKERRRLAEKRRLLEKAKTKGRKGKKATKNAAKQAGTQQPAHHNHAPEHASIDPPHPDDYLEEYEDDAPPMPTSAPPPPQSTANRGPIGTPNAGHSPPIEGPAQIKGGIGDGGTNRPA